MQKLLENRAKKLILNIGVDPALLGYDYIVEAVCISYENRAFLHNITKSLYPTIAKTFDTTPARAERAMRHAIERICAINPDGLKCLFLPMPCSGKFTNSQFIAACCEYLKMEDLSVPDSNEEANGIDKPINLLKQQEDTNA